MYDCMFAKMWTTWTDTNTCNEWIFFVVFVCHLLAMCYIFSYRIVINRSMAQNKKARAQWEKRERTKWDHNILFSLIRDFTCNYCKSAWNTNDSACRQKKELTHANILHIRMEICRNDTVNHLMSTNNKNITPKWKKRKKKKWTMKQKRKQQNIVYLCDSYCWMQFHTHIFSS